MRYRKIVDGEPQFGQSKKDFLQGIDAVAQAISTRLKLFTNEWWEDLEDGLPAWTKIIGNMQLSADDVGMLITERIVGTELNGTNLVPNMVSVENTYNSSTRKFTYNGIAKSLYGQISVTAES